MTSYQPSEAKASQFPFPEYENGDIFLSWGSIAIKAYAQYEPELALKYVKNVLEQYSKDGLAFQRYGRQKQDGRGDDILSGNSLTVTGLYQSIYGINPLYNRFYLDPHITSELAGTRLRYRFRGKTLDIGLDKDSYSVADKGYKIKSAQKFGFNHTAGALWYFNGNNADVSLQAKSSGPVSLTIKNWDRTKMEWQQETPKSAKTLSYTVYQLKPNARYSLSINGKAQAVTSNAKGELRIGTIINSAKEDIVLAEVK